jgi:isoquinoline 1-oxidoreductase beta subunit
MRLNRRSFMIGSAGAAGGLALGLQLPFGGPAVARAQDGSPEIGVWVAIGPDDSVNIRVVRSEMGQGTITGLAQLVAEELECNWSKVKIEYPTPGESVRRKRAWGDFSTGGSRGIRESHKYVREGGAAARMMLVQAAATNGMFPWPSAGRRIASSRIRRRSARCAMARWPRRPRVSKCRRTCRSRIRRPGRSSASP